MNRALWMIVLIGLTLIVTGCGTTRTTDTVRAASEMLLVSQAIDDTVCQMDFSALAGRKVFLDPEYLDNTVDKGYLIGALRQQLLAYGALLQEERAKSEFIVEPRSGAVGTDRNTLLLGTPQMALPTVIPGVPSQIPEIAFMKKTDQKGVAKIAVVAYSRETGQALWQSGVMQANSTLKDTWILGAGPISRGTIRSNVEIAGESLPKLPDLPNLPKLPLPFAPFGDSNPETTDPSRLNLQERTYPQPLQNQQAVPYAMLSLTGPAILLDRPILPVPRPMPLFILEPPPGLLNVSGSENR